MAEYGAAGPGAVKGIGGPKDARQVNLGAAEGAAGCCATTEVVWAKSTEAKRQSEPKTRVTRVAYFIWFSSRQHWYGDVSWNATALVDAVQ